MVFPAGNGKKTFSGRLFGDRCRSVTRSLAGQRHDSGPGAWGSDRGPGEEARMPEAACRILDPGSRGRGRRRVLTEMVPAT